MKLKDIKPWDMLNDIFGNNRNAYNANLKDPYEIQHSWVEKGWLTKDDLASEISLDRLISKVTLMYLIEKTKT